MGSLESGFPLKLNFATLYLGVNVLCEKFGRLWDEERLDLGDHCATGGFQASH
jgi:hypothetical protein